MWPDLQQDLCQLPIQFFSDVQRQISTYYFQAVLKREKIHEYLDQVFGWNRMQYSWYLESWKIWKCEIWSANVPCESMWGQCANDANGVPCVGQRYRVVKGTRAAAGSWKSVLWPKGKSFCIPGFFFRRVYLSIMIYQCYACVSSRKVGVNLYNVLFPRSCYHCFPTQQIVPTFFYFSRVGECSLFLQQLWRGWGSHLRLAHFSAGNCHYYQSLASRGLIEVMGFSSLIFWSERISGMWDAAHVFKSYRETVGSARTGKILKIFD